VNTLNLSAAVHGAFVVGLGGAATLFSSIATVQGQQLVD
jgi:hypothetical protein